MDQGLALQRSMMQHTVKTAIYCRGVGVHSGDPVKLTLHPAAESTGIVFRRSDKGGLAVSANWGNVKESPLCTSLTGQDDVTVGTVEHLMAAFAGAEIDNCLVELDGPEIPIMDGSAEPFLNLIDRAGVIEQNEPRRAIKVNKPVRIGDAARSAALLPAERFGVTFQIDFANELVKQQRYARSIDAEIFRTEIAAARTFVLAEDIEQMRAAGLARGGALENAVVVDGAKVLNADGLRFANEFVRHKVLDAFGDLYLAGGPIIGHFHGVRSGHSSNRQLLEALFADPTAWSWTHLNQASFADAAD